MADRLDLQLISAALRRVGWIRLWAQVVLAVVVMGVLLFNNIGGQIAARADKALRSGRAACWCAAAGLWPAPCAPAREKRHG
jgi:UPF0716 family protein affecting phage T7 exclusion